MQITAAETEGTKQVLQMLRALPSMGGIGLITAPAGTGKTVAIQRAMMDLPHVRRIDPTTSPAGASPRAFFREVAVRLGLGVRACDGAPDIEMMIERHMVKHGLLLVIDQAEELPRSWLSCYRHLADTLGALVLSGGSTFRDRLEGHAGLTVRVAVPFEMERPTLMEVARHFGEEFDPSWIQATYEGVQGSWSGIAQAAKLERMVSTTKQRDTRHATADDAVALVNRFVLRVAA